MSRTRNSGTGAFGQTCVLTNVSPPNAFLSADSGSVSVTVLSTGGGCSWNANLIGADTSWISLAGTTSGTTVNGEQITVSYNYAANNGAPGIRHVALSVSSSRGSTYVFGIDQLSSNSPPLVMSCNDTSGPAQVGSPYTNTCSVSGGSGTYYGYLDGGHAHRFRHHHFRHSQSGRGSLHLYSAHSR